MSREIPDPLPTDWLPRSVAGADREDPDLMEARLRRLTAAAEPTLQRYRSTRSGWWLALGWNWRPATLAALAGAAALVLLLGLGNRDGATRPDSNLALLAAAYDGDPGALWTALGGEADPVLALLVLDEETP